MTIAESSLKFAKIIALIFGALILWSALAFPYPKGLSREFILARERLDNELPRFSEFPCNNPVVIASHGKQFHVSKELKVASQQRPALETKFGCTLWLVDYDDRHSLIEDSELKYLLESLNNEERKMLVEKNAHLEGLFVTR